MTDAVKIGLQMTGVHNMGLQVIGVLKTGLQMKDEHRIGIQVTEMFRADLWVTSSASSQPGGTTPMPNGRGWIQTTITGNDLQKKIPHKGGYKIIPGGIHSHKDHKITLVRTRNPLKVNHREKLAQPKTKEATQTIKRQRGKVASELNPTDSEVAGDRDIVGP